MKLGDVVRVTSRLYPNSAVEGVVTKIVDVPSEPNVTEKHVTVVTFWNTAKTFSENHFQFKVVRAAPVPEPEYGSMYTAPNGIRWVRWSSLDNELQKWISEHGAFSSWSKLMFVEGNYEDR